MSDFKPTENFFTLLDLPRQYAVDVPELTRRYRALQQTIHPDRFSAGAERDRLLAVQKSAQINEAYEVLRSPTRRAAYLLKLAGVNEDLSALTFRDNSFLMQQMELREELSELGAATDPEAALEQFYADVDQVLNQQQRQFASAIDREDFTAAKDSYAKMQFLDKLRYEAEQKESELLDY